jgi:methylthioribose-1-phosphate isomerase
LLDDGVRIIDQTRLPGSLALVELRRLEDFCAAIATMQVRGAPLIGITAAFGAAFALRAGPGLEEAVARLKATRPTAVNLAWALERVAAAVRDSDNPAAAALAEARAIAAEDVAACRAIGEHGLVLLQTLATGTRPLQVLTHCNAGRLATLAWGTATAPIYLALERGLDVHVWVSETRPRNQGASLTAWELAEAGVPFTLVADNACGALMQSGEVDCVMVGSDRTAANGDVCNKVGTYPKALLAREHGVPFYVLLPTSTVDAACARGDDIPIEQRDAAEVLTAPVGGESLTVPGAAAWNPAFDITPAALVTSLVTERGCVAASTEGVQSLGLQP